MPSRFSWALVIALAQAGCDGSDVRTPTEPVVVPPVAASVSPFSLTVFVTSGGRCLANAQLQVAAPHNAVSPPALQTTEFCHLYETGVPYWEPIAFAGAMADNEWPLTVATSAAGYVGKRVEISREQEQRQELLVIDLARE